MTFELQVLEWVLSPRCPLELPFCGCCCVQDDRNLCENSDKLDGVPNQTEKAYQVSKVCWRLGLHYVLARLFINVNHGTIDHMPYLCTFRLSRTALRHLRLQLCLPDACKHYQTMFDVLLQTSSEYHSIANEYRQKLKRLLNPANDRLESRNSVHET